MSDPCPVCGGDRNKDRTTLMAIIAKHRLISSHGNPGGWELVFDGKGRIQLSSMCNACDERELLTFLGETMPTDPQEVAALIAKHEADKQAAVMAELLEKPYMVGCLRGDRDRRTGERTQNPLPAHIPQHAEWARGYRDGFR